MESRDLLYHGQAQPRSRSRPGSVHLIETVKDFLLLLRCDADTVIGHGEDGVAALAFQRHTNRTVFSPVAVGVADQVGQQAGELLAATNDLGPLLNLRGELDAMLL